MTCNSSAALSSGANGTLGGGKVYFHTDNNQYVMLLTLAKHSAQLERVAQCLHKKLSVHRQSAHSPRVMSL